MVLQSHIFDLTIEAFALAFRESQVALGQAICLLVESKYRRANLSLGLYGLYSHHIGGVVILYVIQSNGASNETSCSFRNWEKVLCRTLSMNMVGTKGPSRYSAEFHCSITQCSDQS